MSTTTTPGPGHNQPRPMTPEEVNAYLTDTCQDIIARQKEILAGIERFKTAYPEIPDDDVQGKAADFAGPRKGAIFAFGKTTEARRVIEKQPYDAAVSAAQAFFKTLLDPVAAGQKEIQARMSRYALKREEESRARARAEAEAAAKAAREAEARAMATLTPEAVDSAVQHAKQAEQAERHVAANAATHSRTTGSLGGTVSLRTTYRLNEAESDLMALAKAVVAGTAPLEYLSFNSVRLGYAIRSEGLRTIPGCKIEEIRAI